MSWRPRRLLALALASAGLLCAAAPSPSAAAPWRPFAPDSVWNLPLRADAPLSQRSAAYVAWLNRKLVGDKYWINSVGCSMPVFQAPQGTATTSVRFPNGATGDPALARAWSSVPIPASAHPAQCADKNFAVIQRQPDGRMKQWEMWAALKQADGSWVASWGGVIADVEQDRGFGSPLQWSDPTAPSVWARTSTRGWNVTGTSASMTAGAISYEELQAGRIDHALAVAVPDGAKGRWMWPAQRTDGSSTDADAMPEGARLRIDPSLDLSKLSLSPMVRMLAEAAQRYGMVVKDRTGSNATFYTQELTPEQAPIIRQLFGGKYPNDALRSFPWSRLQVLDAPECTPGSECRVTDRAVIDVDTSHPVAGQPVALDTTNSTLNHPRRDVRWDLDGDGDYERAAGTAVKTSFTPSGAGRRTIGVKIETREGKVATTRLAIDVAAAAGSPRPTAGSAPAAPASPPTRETGRTPKPLDSQRATAPPASTAPAACGRATRITVRAIRSGRHARIAGTLALSRASARCRVSVYRRLGARWLRVSTVRTDRRGRFASASRLPHRGARFRFRVAVQSAGQTLRPSGVLVLRRK